MKTKILTVLAMLACTMLVSAQTFNRIYINITQGTATDQLRLIESPSFTADYDNNYDAVKMFENSNIYVYAMAPNLSATTVAHGKVYTNDLDRLVIGYQAKVAGTATISFSDLKSDLNDVTTYYLYDAVENKLTQVTSTNSYQFTTSVEDDADRFMIVKAAAVTLNADGWASYSSDIALAVADGLTAYQGTSIASDELSLSAIADIPANTGVFLNGTASTTYYLAPVATASANVTSNVIKASVTATDPSTLSGTIYVLSGSALYEYVGTDNIPANKAYLLVANSSNAPKRIRMVVGGAQGIESVEAEAVKSEKVIRDGQIVIIRNGVEYNAAGQIIK